MKKWMLGVCIAFLFGVTAYGWDWFGSSVGNAKVICPRCDTTYTITTCRNCMAEGKFEVTYEGKQIECTNCGEDYATYQCRKDGTIIRKFEIE